MTINALYEQAVEGGRVEEERLFESLTVRFRIFCYQRAWSDEEAGEIVQDALVKVINGYRELTFEVSFSAWAYAVLKSEMLNYTRKKRRRSAVCSGDEPDQQKVEGWSSDPVLEPVLLGCLRKLTETNPRYARILVLKYQGYGSEEICRRLNISAGNFYVMLLRARAALKACLAEGGISV